LFLTISGQWQKTSDISAKSWVFLVLSGLATGASWIAYFRALKIGDAARVAPVDKLSIIMVAIFGVLFLGEKLSAINWAGVVLIAGGVILLTLKI
jgi:transporter family protein